MGKEPEDQKKKMRQAYQAAGRLFREKLASDRPDEAADLSSIRPAEVVVVRGQYDHIHHVLNATDVPYTHIDPDCLPAVDWDPMQVLFVNCPGHLPPAALRRIGRWVKEGGFLITTDWALKHVIEPVFPGTLRHNGQQTSDCVVRVVKESDGDDLLSGFLEDDRDPLWWLEGASYPIEILDSSRVRVLVRSREVGEQWGQDPVVVSFDEGRGTVLHLLSHLYLQRSDVRCARDAQPADLYLKKSLGLSDAELGAYSSDLEGIRSSDFISAMSKARLMSNVVLSSRRKRKTKSGRS